MNERDPVDDAATGPATLPRDVQARWDALADSVRQMASATDDSEGFQAAWNAARQVGRGVDHQQILNAMHVPEDAGEHAEALRGMLVRIPDGWGRWIRCGRGWHPLLVELDEQLRALFPKYELHQVKEKYGGLRYYWESDEDVHDPDDPEPPIPGRGRSDAELAQWEQAHEAWCERLEAYRQTPEGQQRVADLERRAELAEQLVDAAEGRAGVTCELCGAVGRLCTTRPPPGPGTRRSVRPAPSGKATCSAQNQIRDKGLHRRQPRWQTIADALGIQTHETITYSSAA